MILCHVAIITQGLSQVKHAVFFHEIQKLEITYSLVYDFAGKKGLNCHGPPWFDLRTIQIVVWIQLQYNFEILAAEETCPPLVGPLMDTPASFNN